jgi:hypothetical protein
MSKRKNTDRPPSRLRGIAPDCRARRRKKPDMPKAATRMMANIPRKNDSLTNGSPR